MIGFQVYDRFRISEKVSDSIGFGIRHIPSEHYHEKNNGSE